MYLKIKLQVSLRLIFPPYHCAKFPPTSSQIQKPFENMGQVSSNFSQIQKPFENNIPQNQNQMFTPHSQINLTKEHQAITILFNKPESSNAPLNNQSPNPSAIFNNPSMNTFQLQPSEIFNNPSMNTFQPEPEYRNPYYN